MTGCALFIAVAATYFFAIVAGVDRWFSDFTIVARVERWFSGGVVVDQTATNGSFALPDAHEAHLVATLSA